MQIKKTIFFIGLFLLNAASLFAQNAWSVLASPITLQVDTTNIILSDYFPFGNKIDSVRLPKGLQQIVFSNTELTVKGKAEKKVSFISFYIAKERYDIPCFNADKENVDLTLELAIPANKLEIKGTFSSWAPNTKGISAIDPIPSKRWNIQLKKINTGKHQYKLIADGIEVNPLNANLISNGMGGTNVVLEVGLKGQNTPMVKTSAFDKDYIELEVSNAEYYIAFWDHKFVKEEKAKAKKIKVAIPTEAKNKKRSFIRIYAYGNGNISNDVLIPLEYGRVLNSSSLLERSDLHAQIMYFVMVDRFYDGDKTNNPAKLQGVHPKADYYGGDIAGIEKKMNEGYFQNLGFNTLWLSPIAKNPDSAWGLWNKNITTKFSAYHGYWPTSYSLVDKRFGSNTSFTTFISKAHEKDMNIVLDFVAHHIHKDHPLYTQHPDWVTSLYLPDGTMNTERWDDHRLTTWFDTFLPTLDFQQAKVNEVISDSVMYWVKNFDIDGFRHDASKHVPEQFWRTLTKKIRNENHQKNKEFFYQIGETYGSPELIGSYVNSGQMDGQFDFNLYDAGVNAFAMDVESLEESEKNFLRLKETIQESFKYYGAHHLMGNISGNQDKPRFASLAEGTVRNDEDTKLTGWTKDIQRVGQKGYLRIAQMMAMNFGLPGIPVVYYGDEIAMVGANDPDNRRMMKFENLNAEEKALKEKVQLMANLRKNRVELIYGDYTVLPCTKGFFAFERNYFSKKTIFVFSKLEGNASIELPYKALNIKANFNSKVSYNNNLINIELGKDSFEIFTID